MSHLSSARRAFCADRAAHGFSVIELAVASSIVAILVVLLVPVLATARSSAQSSQCQSNQMALGIAYASYVTNEQQYIPESGNTGNSENYGWLDGLPYGTWHAWCPYGTYWCTAVYSPNPYAQWPTTKSTEVGIGLVYRYLSATGAAPTPSSTLDPVGKLFYCPGTPASFDFGPAYGDQYDGEQAVFPGKAWYQTWRAGFGTAPDYNDPTKGGANITYYYRNGAYYNESQPTTTATWTWEFGLRASDPRLHNKAILTCFSPTGNGYTDQQPPYPSWMGPTASVLNTSYLAHGGDKVNLLWSDGSARSYRPGIQNGIAFNLGMCGFFDYTAQSEADYTPYANDGDYNFAFGQMPWFWVMADQGR